MRQSVPIKDTHLQLAGVISGGSQCANQSLSKALTGPISFRWILRWQSQTCSRHAPRPRSIASFARNPIGLSFLSAEYLADRCTEWSTGVIRGHQGSSEVISGNQRPSFRREALRAAEDQCEGSSSCEGSSECEGSSRWLRYQLGVATPAFFMYKSHGARHMQASAYTACTSASRGYASATCAIAVM